ncbi:MAG: hypothetical protein IIX18_03660 [Clostridia bacterium]|nr:hypothetical protein [Clostridia bacterium]MBQ6614397.1 hypothetical protein [Clostridia bacterium]
MDKKFMAEHFDKLCLTNYALIKGEIKGIAIYLSGLQHVINIPVDNEVAPLCAEKSILYIYPFLNPQCWMNSRAVKHADAIIDCAIERYNLRKDIPVGIYGGSMGGYGTFHYAIKSKHNIVAADLNCPCCNIEFELFANQNSVLRTYFESAIDDTDDFYAYVKENSPVNMVDKLPNIPYRMLVGLKDNVLIPSQHGLLMAERMLEAGLDIERIDMPTMGHCNFSVNDKFNEFRWLCDKILANS